MKIEQQYATPEMVKAGEPYRITIQGRDGVSIDIVEQMGGGFSVSTYHKLVIIPLDRNQIIVKVEK